MVIRLSDMYDGDRRRTDPRVRRLSAQMKIPHPLEGVQYADGMIPDRSLVRAAVNRLAKSLGWQVGGDRDDL